ncbi:unnamed protein product [Ambrosiozyma monospora]|uniref:Unnamed protein product n=1 Tax=Ambrosiozyma monospora TaxID=43982 RepID=A0ACB5SR37_AMBMO|nr:unnamed protein product [Ambrosiozyma monospora]
MQIKTRKMPPRDEALVYVSGRDKDRYYIKLLLLNISDPASFTELKLGNDDFRDACLQLGLIESDQEWVNALQTLSSEGSPSDYRKFFVTVLASGLVSDPDTFIVDTQDFLTADLEILHNVAYRSPEFFNDITSPSPSSQLYFLDAPAGYEKTFLENVRMVQLEIRHHKVLAVASSAIAATLLNGVTAHKAFSIQVRKSSSEHHTLNNLKLNSKEWNFFKDLDFLFWDEITMKNLEKSKVLRCLWWFGLCLQLNENVSIAQNSEAQTYADVLGQADSLLKIGSAEAPFDGNLLDVASIPFVNVTEKVDDFSNVNPLQVPLDYYKDRCILAPTNANVDTIKDMMLRRLPSVDDEDAQELIKSPFQGVS